MDVCATGLQIKMAILCPRTFSPGEKHVEFGKTKAAGLPRRPGVFSGCLFGLDRSALLSGELSCEIVFAPVRSEFQEPRAEEQGHEVPELLALWKEQIARCTKTSSKVLLGWGFVGIQKPRDH